MRNAINLTPMLYVQLIASGTLLVIWLHQHLINALKLLCQKILLARVHHIVTHLIANGNALLLGAVHGNLDHLIQLPLFNYLTHVDHLLIVLLAILFQPIAVGLILL
jgi:hypothetical protein